MAELRNVIPADLTPCEIDAPLGAAWIDASYVQHFLREILDDGSLQVESARSLAVPWAPDRDRASPGPPGQRVRLPVRASRPAASETGTSARPGRQQGRSTAPETLADQGKLAGEACALVVPA